MDRKVWVDRQEDRGELCTCECAVWTQASSCSESPVTSWYNGSKGRHSKGWPLSPAHTPETQRAHQQSECSSIPGVSNGHSSSSLWIGSHLSVPKGQKEQKGVDINDTKSALSYLLCLDIIPCSSLHVCKLLPVAITQWVPQQEGIQSPTGSRHVTLEAGGWEVLSAPVVVTRHLMLRVSNY